MMNEEDDSAARPREWFASTLPKNFLSEQRGRAAAQKRGGGKIFVPLDSGNESVPYFAEPVDSLSPDQVFERRWAQTVFQAALNRLRDEYVESGRGPFFGQPDAGTMSGGSYSVAGGFWGIISAIQIPDGPFLTVLRTPINTVLVSWPSPSTGFALQQVGNLNLTNWLAPSEPVTDNGTNKFIIVNPPTGNRFYWLFKP